MKKVQRNYVIMLVIGVLLALGPLWGVIGSVIGMTRAFTTMGQSSSTEVGILANDISFALYCTMAGYLMCPIGLILIAFCAFKLYKLKMGDEW